MVRSKFCLIYRLMFYSGRLFWSLCLSEYWKRTKVCKSFALKLRSIACQLFWMFPIWHVQIPREWYRFLHCVDLGCGDRPFQLQNPVTYYKNMLFSVLVLGSSPKVSMSISSRGTAAGNSCSFSWCIASDLNWLHDQHSSRRLFISLTTYSQVEFCRILSYIQLSSGCPGNGG